MAGNKSSKSKSNNSTPEVAFVEAIFSVIFQLLKWAFNLFRGQTGGGVKGKTLQRQKMQELEEHWQQVEMYVLQPATQTMAISEADKLLDSAFKLMGLPGESMADRLKAGKNYFSADLYQQIWEAHKLRNSLAHEVGAKVNTAEAQQAVSAFRTALYQLKVLS